MTGTLSLHYHLYADLCRLPTFAIHLVQLLVSSSLQLHADLGLRSSVDLLSTLGSHSGPLFGESSFGGQIGTGNTQGDSFDGPASTGTAGLLKAWHAESGDSEERRAKLCFNAGSPGFVLNLDDRLASQFLEGLELIFFAAQKSGILLFMCVLFRYTEFSFSIFFLFICSLLRLSVDDLFDVYSPQFV
ncbi:unnamed protein product [Protopolystoma xenopodis]|uniref:Uncharacterized protein n=1 Tax=Protopolystoma xenopodis TaxID=117903 RepID=A0A3S5ADT1_9PLAT|nr:unnamed protein product [Protopolystoma xenopodis]